VIHQARARIEGDQEVDIAAFICLAGRTPGKRMGLVMLHLV
jgi:hypothetical protein